MIEVQQERWNLSLSEIIPLDINYHMVEVPMDTMHTLFVDQDTFWHLNSNLQTNTNLKMQ